MKHTEHMEARRESRCEVSKSNKTVHVMDGHRRKTTLCGELTSHNEWVTLSTANEASCLSCLELASKQLGRTVENERQFLSSVDAKLQEIRARDIKRHLPSEQIDNDLCKAHCGYVAEYKEDVWAMPCYECDSVKLYEIAVDKLTCPKCAEWYAHLAAEAIRELQEKIKQTQDIVRKEGAK